MIDASKERMRERLGNIDQIRDLLFGQVIKNHQERFENCEQRLDRLETELTQFQTEIRDRLTHLQSDLATEIRSGIDTLEKKLQYLSLTTQDETSNLKQELHSVVEHHSESIESLHHDFETKTESLQDDLNRTKQALQEDVQTLKKQVLAELEQGFANLKESKMSRTELAEFLFELCFKVKGTQRVPELKEAEERLARAELLLPEQQE